MNKLAASAICTALATTLLASCATYTGQTNDPNDPNRTKRGALIGAGIGAVAGLLTGSDAVERRQHALIGAGVGAIADAWPAPAWTWSARATTSRSTCRAT